MDETKKIVVDFDSNFKEFGRELLTGMDRISLNIQQSFKHTSEMMNEAFNLKGPTGSIKHFGNVFDDVINDSDKGLKDFQNTIRRTEKALKQVGIGGGFDFISDIQTSLKGELKLNDDEMEKLRKQMLRLSNIENIAIKSSRRIAKQEEKTATLSKQGIDDLLKIYEGTYTALMEKGATSKEARAGALEEVKGVAGEVGADPDELVKALSKAQPLMKSIGGSSIIGERAIEGIMENFKGIASILGMIKKFSFLAGLAAIVDRLLDARKAVREQRAGLVDMWLTANEGIKDVKGNMSDFMRGRTSEFEEMNKAILEMGMNWLMSGEEVVKIAEGINKAGFNMRDIYTDVADQFGQVSKQFTGVNQVLSIAGNLGVSFEELTGEFSTMALTLGKNLQQTTDDFMFLRRAAVQSGISAIRYTNSVIDMASAMAKYAFTIAQVSDAYKNLRKTTFLPEQGAKELTQTIIGYFQNASDAQTMALVTTSKEWKKNFITDMKEVYDKLKEKSKQGLLDPQEMEKFYTIGNILKKGTNFNLGDVTLGFKSLDLEQQMKRVYEKIGQESPKKDLENLLSMTEEDIVDSKNLDQLALKYRKQASKDQVYLKMLLDAFGPAGEDMARYVKIQNQTAQETIDREIELQKAVKSGDAEQIKIAKKNLDEWKKKMSVGADVQTSTLAELQNAAKERARERRDWIDSFNIAIDNLAQGLYIKLDRVVNLMMKLAGVDTTKEPLIYAMEDMGKKLEKDMENKKSQIGSDKANYERLNTEYKAALGQVTSEMSSSDPKVEADKALTLLNKSTNELKGMEESKTKLAGFKQILAGDKGDQLDIPKGTDANKLLKDLMSGNTSLKYKTFFGMNTEGLRGAKAHGDKNIAATGPYLLHKGEAVIPASINPYTKGGGASPATPNISFSFNNYAPVSDEAGMKRLAEIVYNKMEPQIRQTVLKVGKQTAASTGQMQ